MEKLIQVQQLNIYDDEIKLPVNLKIINDAKGNALFLNSLENINAIGILEFMPNLAIRGNHYHKIKKEILYIIKGRLMIYFWKAEGNCCIENIIVQSGCLVTIEPNIAHAYKAIEPTFGIEMSPNVYNPNDTIYDYKI